MNKIISIRYNSLNEFDSIGKQNHRVGVKTISKPTHVVKNQSHDVFQTIPLSDDHLHQIRELDVKYSQSIVFFI